MIDCHCHILPGIDDGSPDLAYSLKMARVAVASGITEIVATPHHLNGVYQNPKAFILSAVAELQAHLNLHQIPLKLHPGSEVHLAPELLEQEQNGELMTYGNHGKAMLVEFPKHSIPTGSEPILENLVYRGITPIVAHPERNTTLRNESNRIAEWISIGCKMQLTTQSCDGMFGNVIEDICRNWCEKGWVHLIASDAHRTERRSPDMRAGAANLQAWLGTDAARILTIENPRRLVSGEQLIDLPAVIQQSRKRGASLFRWLQLP